MDFVINKNYLVIFFIIIFAQTKIQAGVLTLVPDVPSKSKQSTSQTQSLQAKLNAANASLSTCQSALAKANTKTCPVQKPCQVCTSSQNSTSLQPVLSAAPEGQAKTAQVQAASAAEPMGAELPADLEQHSN